ncbi:hypothetical protein TNCV_2931941 [Trichonephila clavipes]|nr:hypothetical protein TNCV_2931941 [Trichonephila clavipes]
MIIGGAGKLGIFLFGSPVAEWLAYLALTPQVQDSNPGLSLSSLQWVVTVRFGSVYPNLYEEHSKIGQEPPNSISLLPTSRQDLRLDGYLECSLAMHYTFTTIHTISGIRTQALRPSSQRH